MTLPWFLKSFRLEKYTFWSRVRKDKRNKRYIVKKNLEPAAELEKLSKNSAKFFNSFGEFPNFCRILPHLPLPVLKRCFLSSCPGSDAVMFLGMGVGP